MANKRFQVFVSSTFEDLQAERQAAVQAILEAGDIPAGMELFTANDRSQMQVIRDWIDRSDIFVVMLGGRYGSIDAESGKSYVQLEFEHARDKQKPTLALVLHEARIAEIQAGNPLDMRLEQNEPAKYQSFRETLRTNRLTPSFADPKDLKHEILRGLHTVKQERAAELRGWVRGDYAARLEQENTRLKADAPVSDPNRIPWPIAFMMIALVGVLAFVMVWEAVTRK